MQLLLRKRTIIAASLSLIIFSSAISVLMGIGEAPRSFLGSQDVYVITDKGTNSVINSKLDISLADQLIELGIVDDASPEIFAFGELRGSAVVIRGVNFTSFLVVEAPQLIEGELPDDSDLSNALVGKRLAERINLAIGDRIPLVGSYNPSVAEVEIRGIIESGSGIDDELIVSLPVAQTISGTPSSQVSIIRVRGDIETLESIFSPGTARFSIYDLFFPSREIAVNSTMEIAIWLKNWGGAEGVAEVRIVDETSSVVLLEGEFNLSAGSSMKLTTNFSSEAEGERIVTAYLSGTLPQNISANITVRGPYLTIVAPEQVAEFHNFSAQVIDHKLLAIQNATVSIDGYSYLTDVDGICLIDANISEGDYNITASFPGYETGRMGVEVINSSLLPQVPVIEAYDLELLPETVKVGENCTVALYVQNRGNTSGMTAIRLFMNGNLFRSQVVSLEPLQATVVYYNVSFSTSGERLFSTDSISKTLTVESTYQINPDIVKLLLTYGNQGSIDPSRGDLIYNTAKISEGNIVIVLFSLALLSGTLVTLGVSIIFMKEINDNIRVIGILRSIGASSRQLLGMIFRESILLSLPAACIGIVGGILLALLVSASGRLIAFGHVIEPVIDPTFLIAAVLGSMVICVGSSLIAGLSVSRKKAIGMIRGLEEEIGEYPTIEELLRDNE